MTLPLPPSPMCQTCEYRMASESSKTGWRCGLEHFRASPIMRKFKIMTHYPEVKPDNACESWLPKQCE